jgi:hypothetical protein
MTERNDRFWAAFLAVSVSDWETPGVSVRPHAGLAPYRGVWFFQRRGRVVVSAPPGWTAFLEERLAGSEAATLMNEAFLAGLFGADGARLIGPAFQGSLAPDRFRPRAHPDVRSLTPADAPAVAVFRRECGEDAWAESGLEEATHAVAAAFEGGRVVAMTGYRAWSDDAGDPCVLAHPAHRRSGWATATTSAVVAAALADGKLLLYQTLEANTGAVKVALALGYEQYARHFAMQLQRDAPG